MPHGQRHQVNNGKTGNSVLTLINRFELPKAVANGSSGPAKQEKTIEQVVASTPSSSQHMSIAKFNLNAEISEVVESIGIVKKVPAHTAQQVETAIQTQIRPSTATMVYNTPVLPLRTEASSNAKNLAKNAGKLIPALNLAGSTNKSNKKGANSKKSKEEGNKTIVNNNFFAEQKKQVQSKKGLSMVNKTPSNATPNAPSNATPNAKPKAPSNATPNATPNKTPNAVSIPASAPAPVVSEKIEKAVQAVQAEQAEQAKQTKAAPTQQQSRPEQKEAMSAFKNLPFNNLENLANLARKSGFGVSPGPEPLGIAAEYAPKRVGQKTMKKIKFNTEQKKILERKIRKAEEQKNRRVEE